MISKEEARQDRTRYGSQHAGTPQKYDTPANQISAAEALRDRHLRRQRIARACPDLEPQQPELDDEELEEYQDNLLERLRNEISDLKGAVAALEEQAEEDRARLDALEHLADGAKVEPETEEDSTELHVGDLVTVILTGGNVPRAGRIGTVTGINQGSPYPVTVNFDRHAYTFDELKKLAPS